MNWNPQNYLIFGDERTRPAADLLARVPLDRPKQVVDLGCGPGNSTALLAWRWPDADLTGIDQSSAMLERARSSGLRASWEQADIATWTLSRSYELVFANAVFQWLPDHAGLFSRLLQAVAQGGVLAVQMPINFDQPSHQLMRGLAADQRFAPMLQGRLHPRPVENASWYYDLLRPFSAALDIWSTEYHHVLHGPDPVLAWVKATGLRPVREALDDPAYEAFEAIYAKRLREAYPARGEETLFPFRRLFIVAVRA